MTIKEFADIYFNLPEEERDINDWYPVLDFYILNLCNKYYNLFTHEERYQLAWIGAIKAIRNYDISTGNKFQSFLYICMRNEILLERKRFYDKISFKYGEPENGTYATMSINSKYGEEEDLELVDILTDGYCVDNDGVANADIELFTRRLSEMDATIVKGLYEGKDQSELARCLGVSTTTIHRHVHKIQAKDEKILKAYIGG